MDDDAYIMWLMRTETVGAVKQRQLINHFGSARAVFEAGVNELSWSRCLTRQNIEKLLSRRDERLPEEHVRELETKKIRFISIFNQDYPELLKQIHDPPLGFYIVGSMPSCDMVKVALIGARRCTDYGVTVAKQLSRGLAQKGVVIVSGMARGIDSAAHRGAVESGGQTIAVLGCGVDVCYPPENIALREHIINHGCIISEYPPGSHAERFCFPMRNRIISGLSSAVIVVEAAERSGTLITADHALEQGREVMAVPGNITSKLSMGTNGLIKQGAAAVTCCEDVLAELGISEAGNNSNVNKNNNTGSLASEEKLIYDIIGFQPVSVDEIVVRLDSQAQTVNYILTLLEIKGLVRRLPGQRYIRYV